MKFCLTKTCPNPKCLLADLHHSQKLPTVQCVRPWGRLWSHTWHSGRFGQNLPQPLACSLHERSKDAAKKTSPAQACITQRRESLPTERAAAAREDHHVLDGIPIRKAARQASNGVKPHNKPTGCEVWQKNFGRKISCSLLFL